MTSEELKEIIEGLRKQQKDDAHYEAKTCKEKLSNDVWESVSAFGNTRGGTLLLGIEETNNFQPVKNFPIEKIIDQFVEGIGDGGKKGRKVENPPQYTLERVDFEGSQILVVKLAEVENRFKPCFLSSKGLANGSFKRVDDRDIKLSATEVFELQHILEPSLADREAVAGATEQDLDESLVDSLLISEREKDSKALRNIRSRDDALKRLNVMTPDGQIALSGLLCLGSYPQQFFPKLVVDIAVHPGIEKSQPGAPRFMDRVICEGSIGEMIDEAVLAVAKNLRTFSYVEGSGRRDELEIPREVLREAIANAVIHREYGVEFVGQSVSVDIYSDRVEITNPGGLWGGKTVETLTDGQSRCRNNSLIKLAAKIQRPKEGAPVEGQGSGIPLMFREMQAHALGEPRFNVGMDYFTVVLQRGGAELSRNKEWLNQLSSRETNSEESAVLLELHRRKQATVQELHSILGYDSDDIRAICARLLSEGLLIEDPIDTYFIVGDEKAFGEERKRTTREAILDVLTETRNPIGAQEIARLTGRKISTLRAQIAKLVAEGEIIPTAAPTDRNRKYYLASK